MSLASLRLTVVLFVLAIILVFAGTLAQREAGIWTVVNDYFRTAFVWIPFQIFFPSSVKVAGGFPFLGGWLIGGLLLANLIAAHAVRFKVSWKRSGILLIHAGLIVMMLGELFTGLFAIEGNMVLENGKSSNFIEQNRRTELAIVDPSPSRSWTPGVDNVVVIPQSLLQKGGLIQHDALPFDIEVVRYMVNSDLDEDVKPSTPNPATAGDGLNVVALERPEVSGASQDDRDDVASAYVTLKKKGTGEVLGTYLVSLWLSLSKEPPQLVTVDDKTYEIALRRKRTYKPYTLHLLEFKHEKYVGTDTPKNFSSLVRLTDAERGEDREVLIYMNNPLRYAGETFYQQGFLPGDKGTILQVVRNPGWLLPYVSCVMVALGMLVHFGMHLISFLRVRAAQ